MSWGVARGPSLWTWSSLRREGDLPCEWLGDNPCVQTLQSLGTFTGASHPEIQCRLHNQDIKSRVIYLHCLCGGLCDSGENDKDFMISVYNWTVWFL